MPLLIQPERSSHWYIGTQPFFEVPNKSKPGTMRPANKMDAKAAGAVPSVTTILKVIHKPQLQNWLVEQSCLAAITLPRLPGETEDEFAKRVVEDMDAQGQKARELGSDIHAACAEYAKGSFRMMPDLDLTNRIYAFKEWFDENIIGAPLAVEQVLVGDGYAGTVDLIANVKDAGLSVIDIKTQNVKNGKPAFWMDWSLQLGAYRVAFALSSKDMPKAWSAKLISLVIDTNSPYTVYPKVWSEGTFDRDYYYGIFRNCYELWRFINNW